MALLLLWQGKPAEANLTIGTGLSSPEMMSWVQALEMADWEVSASDDAPAAND